MGENIILTVSQLTRSARQILEQNFAKVWVEGELSNFATPQSGHWYFTLKDKSAQLRCAMFAGRNRSVSFKPHNGLKVLIRGKVSLYEGRGDFQVIVDRLEPAGEGALRLAFEALKKQLAEEGLFAEERKRALPTYPEHLVIMSSGTGAAYQDVLSVIQRRYPGLLISLMPVAVQGPDSEVQVLKALSTLNTWITQSILPRGASHNILPSLLLITRGGGSLEDLWTFNLETVARELAKCPIPTVSAIGHETDFTITDYIADLRAPTPSAAAEIITPDKNELLGRFLRINQSLKSQMRRSLVFHQQQLKLASKQLTSPREKLQQQMQGLDDIRQRLERAFTHSLNTMQGKVIQTHTRLLGYQPLKELGHAHQGLRSAYQQLLQEIQHQLQRSGSQLLTLSRAMHAVSPLETLARGYAIVTKPEKKAGSRWGATIDSVKAVTPGESVLTQLADGKFESIVQSVTSNDEEPAA